MAYNAQERVEAYLEALRLGLKGVQDEDASEIIREMRSHILDRASAEGQVTDASMDAALRALGSPDDLAKEYVTDHLITQAEKSRMPLHILGSAFRWASLSVAGVVVLVGSIVGYTLSIAAILCAVSKPFHPRTAGLWVFRDTADDPTFSLRLGLGHPVTAGQDLLGWWIVPVGLCLGWVLLTLTTRTTLWFLGRYRKQRALPHRWDKANEAAALPG
jgi:hypothetical protein